MSIAKKIIIVTSTIVIISGITAGAIIIPKEIQKIKIQKEIEEDLANISIVLKRNEISIPLNGTVQEETIDRYTDLETVLTNNSENEFNKEELDKALIDIFVESYTGGELSVKYDPIINISKKGDYLVTFTVTSEKENTKSETATISVINYFKASISIDNTDITIEKGTQVAIMEGVTFESNLPAEEQGHIETTGTVDVNTVGTYTITYTYIPKDETEGVISEQTRTYTVIEKPRIQQGVTYRTKYDGGGYTYVTTLYFQGNSYTLTYGPENAGFVTINGTYVENNGTITFYPSNGDDESGWIEVGEPFTGRLSNNGRSIIIGNNTYSL